MKSPGRMLRALTDDLLSVACENENRFTAVPPAVLSRCHCDLLAVLEIVRRVIGALDLGLRAGEMLRVQVKHVDYDAWKIHLPASVTKAGTDQIVYAGSARLREVLESRRARGPEAYVFGREDGAFVGSFKKAWMKLFALAGLSVGRKGGFVWHDLRHEYGSSLVKQGATIQEAKEMMLRAL